MTVVTNMFRAAWHSQSGRMRLLLSVLFVGLIVQAGIGVLAVHSERGAINEVGRASAEVTAAAKIQMLLADAESAAANEALPGQVAVPGEAGKTYCDPLSAGNLKPAQRQFLEDVCQVYAELSQLHPASQAEQDAVADVGAQLSQYVDKIAAARAYLRNGDPVGAGYIQYGTVFVMRSQLLPSAQNLQKLNEARLASATSAEATVRHTFIAVSIVAALAFLGVLVLLNATVARIWRNRITRSMAAAGVVSLLFTLVLLIKLTGAGGALSGGLSGPFQNVTTVSQAQVLAYGLKSDQSLYLLKRGGDKKYNDHFSENLPKLDAAIDAESVQSDLPGEKQFASQVKEWYQRYKQIDAGIREAEKGGDHGKAVALATGLSEGQSNWAFQQLDQSQSRIIALNLAAFDDTIRGATDSLRFMDVAAIVVALLSAGLLYAGMRSKLAIFA